MLMGLKEGQEKMSKSDPDSAIFMEDAAEDVKRKVNTVQCSAVQYSAVQSVLYDVCLKPTAQSHRNSNHH